MVPSEGAFYEKIFVLSVVVGGAIAGLLSSIIFILQHLPGIYMDLGKNYYSHNGNIDIQMPSFIQISKVTVFIVIYLHKHKGERKWLEGTEEGGGENKDRKSYWLARV